MSKRNRSRFKIDAKGQTIRSDTYVQLFHWMLDDPRWMNLSPNAKVALVAVARFHNGFNNGRIGFSVRQGNAWGLSAGSTSRALAELQAAGLLAMSGESSFDGKASRARRWRLCWLHVKDEKDECLVYATFLKAGVQRPEKNSAGSTVEHTRASVFHGRNAQAQKLA